MGISTNYDCALIFFFLVYGFCRLKTLFVPQREHATDLYQWLQLLNSTNPIQKLFQIQVIVLLVAACV